MSFLQRILEIRNGRRLSVLAPSRTARLARQSGSVVVSALLIVAALAIPARGQNGSEDKTKPKSDISTLPEVARERISATLGRDRTAYKTTAQTGGFRMKNPRNGLSAEFTSSGVSVWAGSSDWGMALGGYGYGEKLLPASVARPSADANRVEYRHAGLTEWYENGPLGLEQGFTFACAPGKSQGQPLTLALTLSGKLSASIDPDRRGLTLRKNGTAALRYAGLAATDANGRQLPAWMEVAGSRLQLRVDDSRARYPVTVDPLLQTAELTSSDSTFLFGDRVAISRDGSTIVAMDEPDGNHGVAYLFLKPTNGWATTSTYTAKLTSSDWFVEDDGLIKADIAPSADGSTIVVGVPDQTVGSNSFQGLALVFVKPTSGWASSSPLTESAQLVASDGAAKDLFGTDVAISDDGGTIVASGRDGPDNGAAYIFLRPSTGWMSSSPLTETNVIVGPPSLGDSVALSADGNTLATGEPGVQIGDAPNQGQVEVFVTTDSWTSFRTSQLTASDGQTNDSLGVSVSMSSDASVIAAGALRSEASVGAVYIFVRPANGWGTTSNVAELSPSEHLAITNFPYSVRMSGDGTTVVAGRSPGGTGAPPDGGAVFVFVKPGSGWTNSNETAKLTDGTTSDEFGSWVGISESRNPIVYRPPFLTIIASAPVANFGSSHVGALYVFTGYALSSLPVFSLNQIDLTAYAGSTSGSQPVTLTNSGTAPLGISSVAATGPFSSTQNCVAASPIAPGASCIEYVTFAASGVGTFTGTLTVTDDAGEVDGSTQQVTLAGMGTQASTTTTITSVSPNPALVGQSVTVSFSVAPPAGDTLTPSGTVTVKASTGESCTGAAPSGSCSLSFSTAVTRTIIANYAGDNNFLSSMSAAVSEVVTDFNLTVTPATQTIPSGHDGVYTLTLSPINGLTGTISLTCSGGPPNSTCTVSPSSITLAGSAKTATGTVSLLPPKNVDHGTFSLTFTASDGALIHSVTVSLTVK